MFPPSRETALSGPAISRQLGRVLTIRCSTWHRTVIIAAMDGYTQPIHRIQSAWAGLFGHDELGGELKFLTPSIGSRDDHVRGWTMASAHRKRAGSKFEPRRICTSLRGPTVAPTQQLLINRWQAPRRPNRLQIRSFSHRLILRISPSVAGTSTRRVAATPRYVRDKRTGVPGTFSTP